MGTVTLKLQTIKADARWRVIVLAKHSLFAPMHKCLRFSLLIWKILILNDDPPYQFKKQARFSMKCKPKPVYYTRKLLIYLVRLLLPLEYEVKKQLITTRVVQCHFYSDLTEMSSIKVMGYDSETFRDCQFLWHCKFKNILLISNHFTTTREPFIYGNVNRIHFSKEPLFYT